ncbi:hypothetical protein ElyMa_001889200 [Elysia marginata]|uniref:G-protein coupled receptors family 1 profile domain-containing protein n=1 Tax=Elysia marginata TaxID=1093978 RepID=A0AAV4ERT1_9GAST|nr:hypothetical protein ElyMa_001889200 [Elysia marginata]
MSNASSNVTTERPRSSSDYYNDYRTALTILLTCDFIGFFLVLAINGWLLGSILTSVTLRSKLRNQIICGVAVLHLLEDLLITPFDISYWLAYLNRWNTLKGCAIGDYLTTMIVICTVIPDLLLVILASVFLAQVLDFDPASKLRPRYLRIGHIGILAFPWVFAGVITPLTLVGISHKGFPCLYVNWRRYYIVEAVFTVFPLCLASVIIGMPAVFDVVVTSVSLM